MANNRESGESLLLQHLGTIERTTQSVSARQGLDDDAHNELRGLAFLKLIEDDYAALRCFRGNSSWHTYLRVVIHRVLLDHRTKEWGRWRPSARARRLGSTAIRLERLLDRDGWTVDDAIRLLLSQGVSDSRSELETLSRKVTRRPQRRMVSVETHAGAIPSQAASDQRLMVAEQQKQARRLRKALARALRDLPREERQLLELRFRRGWTVRRIAASLQTEARPLYRRFSSVLKSLRRQLEERGLRWRDIEPSLECREVELEIDLS